MTVPLPGELGAHLALLEWQSLKWQSMEPFRTYAAQLEALHQKRPNSCRAAFQTAVSDPKYPGTGSHPLPELEARSP